MEKGLVWASIPATARVLACFLLISIAPTAAAQALMTSENGDPAKPMAADMTILDVRERRVDLPCEIVRVNPRMDFDLRLHARFQVKVPISAFAGTENLLTMIFRVTPVEPEGTPAYFYHRTLIPAVEDGRSGDLYSNGSFDVGPGRYRVDFLVRDRAHHVCSDYWELQAGKDVPEDELRLSLAPGAVEPSQEQVFKEEPPILRAQDRGLRVKVLVNFAPQNRYAPTLNRSDYLPLLSILRGVSRQPQFGKFSLVAFNLDEQRVFYRQDDADRIDFPALGEAMQDVSPSVVSVSNLGQNAEADFLASMLAQELSSGDPLDAVIFAGPKTIFDERISKQTLHSLGDLKAPIFYLNYNADPVARPWRDAIGHAVKFWKGIEYSISRPRDLWGALNSMVNKVVSTRETGAAFTASSQ